MKPYYEANNIRIYHGDCREVDVSGVSAVVTDPPYGLKFMGKGWDKGVPGVEFWEHIGAACLPGAYMVAFGGTRTHHRLMCAIEDAGWEIRDCLMWLYGSGFPKSLDVSKAIDKAVGVEREVVGRRKQPQGPQSVTRRAVQSNHGYRPPGAEFGQLTQDEIDITTPATDAAKQWDGWGTALKPAWEPIVLARKPFSGTVAVNVQEHGTGAINVDGCRIEGVGAESGRRRHGGGIVGNAPSYELLDSHGQQPSGRFPANVLLDEEAAAMLDEQSGEGDISRFFYCAKASHSERNIGGVDNTHPTVKPLDLMMWLIKLITPPKGLILDPFMGSGTTLLGANKAHLPAIGIDKDEGSCEIAARRLRAAQGLLSYI